MTSTEWSPVDTPSSACAPDLFGGELFGDELIDMYNTEVGPNGGKHDGPFCIFLCAIHLTLGWNRFPQKFRIF
jgi:hypothetical protein